MAEPATQINIETNDDGSVVVNLSDRQPRSRADRAAERHDDNLAETLPDQVLQTISQELLEGITADEASRQAWVDNYNQGLKLLGLLLEQAGGLDAKTSMVRHPALLWAIIKFQAQARSEMLPTAGPCKVERADPNLSDQLAQTLEDDMNYYLRVSAPEYYPDTDRGLFYVGYGGTIFKKVYIDPLRGRPVSETVQMTDLIISNETTDLENAARVTHRISMSRQDILRMQDIEYWADVSLLQPSMEISSTQLAEGQAVGIQFTPTRPQDYQHTIYECYTGLDLGRWGLSEKGQSSGINLPYRVTLDKHSRQIYEVRRNWRATDPSKRARRRFVKWGLIPGIGYLDLGYLNLLGNQTVAMTALERILIDAGIFSNYPGGVRAKGMRLETNEIRPGPGEFQEVDTGGLPLQQAIMPLPFKGPTAEVLALLQHLEDQAEKTAGQVELETGEGRTNVPVGTIMAAIEQQTQILVSNHKRLHTSQAEELTMLRECFVDMGDEGLALLRRSNTQQPYTLEQLGSAGLVPASDPNTPAFIHRIMQGTVLETLSRQHPQVYNEREVQMELLRVAKFSEETINRVVLPLQPPGPIPPPQPSPDTVLVTQAQSRIEEMRIAGERADAEAKAAAQQQANQQKHDQRLAEIAAEERSRQEEIAAETERQERDRQAEATQAELERQSREDIAAMNDQTTLITKGIEQLGEPASSDPAHDDKAGP